MCTDIDECALGISGCDQKWWVLRTDRLHCPAQRQTLESAVLLLHLPSMQHQPARLLSMRVRQRLYATWRQWCPWHLPA